MTRSNNRPLKANTGKTLPWKWGELILMLFSERNSFIHSSCFSLVRLSGRFFFLIHYPVGLTSALDLRGYVFLGGCTTSEPVSYLCSLGAQVVFFFCSHSIFNPSLAFLWKYNSPKFTGLLVSSMCQQPHLRLKCLS